jgi:hypothetical protein
MILTIQQLLSQQVSSPPHSPSHLSRSLHHSTETKEGDLSKEEVYSGCKETLHWSFLQ